MSTNRFNGQTIIALVVGIAMVASSAILADGIKNMKGAGHKLTVKGSAREAIKSDYAIWNGSFSASGPVLQDSYQQLTTTRQKVQEFMKKNGFKDAEVTFNSVSSQPIYEILPNGGNSNRIESYKLVQMIEIQSHDVDKIAEIARNSTELINQGIDFQSNQPQYFYTKLADKKVAMIESASKDARTRAAVLLKSSGKQPGALLSASVGVFQITPPYSNDVADEGMNDTTSIDKVITSVVNCEFEIQ